MSERVVLFDFDGTLTRHDTLIPFLYHLSGPWRFAWCMLWSLPVLGAYALGWMRNDVAKQRMLGHFLAGRQLAELEQAGQDFAAQALDGMLRPQGMAKLHEHLAAGDCCVLVSASLDVWLQPWAQRHGVQALISSRLETDPAGRVNGRLWQGNCHGEDKVRRVQAWLQGRDAVITHAYSDSRVDLPMLALARQGYLWRGKGFVLVQ